MSKKTSYCVQCIYEVHIFQIISENLNPMKVSKTSKQRNKNRNYALLSVFDKTGIIEFAKILDQNGYWIVSTGGTAKVLIAAEIPVVPIQNITGNPESFDGRMKTISFQTEGGILYDRKNAKHVRQARELGVPKIDIVVCNLYPFEATVQKKGATDSEIIESIDVGGPTMIRSGGKNHENVLVVTDPNDYIRVAEALEKDVVTVQLRRALAAKAFGHLAFYDAQIAKHLSEDKLPNELTLPGRRSMDLRYGENPHQNPSSVFFEPGTNSPLGKLKKQIGRELSHVNVTDIAAGLESVRIFKNKAAAAIIKHNSPCGIAIGKDAQQALRRAVEADPQSAFGGVAVLNTQIDRSTAKAFAQFKADKVQMDIVAAPSITDEAKKIINDTRKTTGIYTFGKIPAKRSNPMHLRFIDGGHVAQPWDDGIEIGFANWTVETKKKPTKLQFEQMKVGWMFVSRIKSNTILVMDPELPMTRGIGSGQTSRIGSVKIALEQAGKRARGAVLISDSFFPFDDSVRYAAKHGITAIVQQGGSQNDKLSIAAANELGISMVFTHRRAFWH